MGLYLCGWSLFPSTRFYVFLFSLCGIRPRSLIILAFKSSILHAALVGGVSIWRLSHPWGCILRGQGSLSGVCIDGGEAPATKCIFSDYLRVYDACIYVVCIYAVSDVFMEAYYFHLMYTFPPGLEQNRKEYLCIQL